MFLSKETIINDKYLSKHGQTVYLITNRKKVYDKTHIFYPEDQIDTSKIDKYDYEQTTVYFSLISYKNLVSNLPIFIDSINMQCHIVKLRNVVEEAQVDMGFTPAVAFGLSRASAIGTTDAQPLPIGISRSFAIGTTDAQPLPLQSQPLQPLQPIQPLPLQSQPSSFGLLRADATDDTPPMGLQRSFGIDGTDYGQAPLSGLPIGQFMQQGGAIVTDDDIIYHYYFNYYVEIYNSNQFSHILLISYYDAMRFIQIDMYQPEPRYNFIIRMINQDELYKSIKMRELQEYNKPPEYINTVLKILFNNNDLTTIDILKILDIDGLKFDKSFMDNDIFKTDETYRLCNLISHLKYDETLSVLLGLKTIMDYNIDKHKTINLQDDKLFVIEQIKLLLTEICDIIGKCENKQTKDIYEKILCSNDKLAENIYIFIDKIFTISKTNNNLLDIIVNNKDLLNSYWYATKHIYKNDRNIEINLENKPC